MLCGNNRVLGAVADLVDRSVGVVCRPLDLVHLCGGRWVTSWGFATPDAACFQEISHFTAPQA